MCSVLHLSPGFLPLPRSAPSSLPHTLRVSCRRKPGGSNMCQRAEHAREGSHKPILPELCRGNGNKAENISDSPSCQAQALLNFPSLVSCSPRERGTADGNSLSKRTAYSRQSPEHFHKEAWLAQGGTHHHGHCAGLDEQAVPSSSVQAKPQNPTQSQQCLARGGTCKPLECMLPGRQATHTGLPGQAAALRAARAGDKGFTALEFLTSGQHRHSTGWRGWH